ncbi:translesion DNA synthesis-associated protein ImuA [Steroidobacter sp. S1-65]|uniref:Translesion DNA synthesis-associated protein ImuA n=1 Tax=Steroidobacter gossypii TaxID=2805490 RepID=A0ABS1WWS9_9GAMM|nr:translesion DNA synthesis-associated protein ImuA [Steroidobacter gossypii]MBM0105436.1 translesion DNA synthesis-associated protein ImuA [Steroidobacter gossypii]
MNTVTLADIPLLWRAESLAPVQSQCVSTGYQPLDRALGGGWPLPSLIELLCDDHGIGELRLLVGLLRTAQGASALTAPKIVLWLSPPFELHAIALTQYGLAPNDHWVCSISQPADLQWAMTQALRSGACLAVIAWTRHLKPAALRTLKLAAMTGRSVGVLFRPTSETRLASPATLRIALRPQVDELELAILKMQGRRPSIVRIAPSDVDRVTREAR